MHIYNWLLLCSVAPIDPVLYGRILGEFSVYSIQGVDQFARRTCLLAEYCCFYLTPSQILRIVDTRSWQAQRRSKQDDNDGQPERGSYNNPGTRMVPVLVVALHSPCFVPTRSIGNAIILAPVSPVSEASKYTQLPR